jgi:SSS family solute:Na+ symporter
MLPVFIFIVPGMIALALARSGRYQGLTEQLIGPDGAVITDNAQAALPLMVATVLPVGLRGIVVAGLLAALMSSLAGVFNASATLFTMDFYSRFRPDTSQRRLVWIGRIATGVMVLIGLVWIPVIQGGRGLYDYLQGVQAYLAPPIAVVFFLGVLNRRTNAKGALATLLVGFAMGLFRLAIDTPVKLGGVVYDEGSFTWIVNNIFFQYYSLLITLVCVAVMLGVSYATEAPSEAQIAGLTFGSTSREDRARSRESWNHLDVILSAVVLLLILTIYLTFTG